MFCAATKAWPAQGPGGRGLGLGGWTGEAEVQLRLRGQNLKEHAWKLGIEGVREPFRVFGQEGHDHLSALEAGSGEW